MKFNYLGQNLTNHVNNFIKRRVCVIKNITLRNGRLCGISTIVKSRQNYGREHRPTITYSSKPKEKLSVMFFGTDKFSLESLKLLYGMYIKGTVKKLCVVTIPQKQALHPVAIYCQENNFPYETWPPHTPISDFDIGIISSFGHLIPLHIIQSFPLGILNVHASLLPRWRGAAPIMHTILNGDKVTGVTVMRVHPYRFDVGEIVYQRTMGIMSIMKSGELATQLASLGAECLSECLDNLQVVLENATPQPFFGVMPAPKIKEIDAQIIWEKMSPMLISRMFMAYDDIYPLWTTWQGIRVKLRGLNEPSISNLDPLSPNYDPNSNITSDNLDVYQYIKKILLCPRKSVDEMADCEHSPSLSGRILYMRQSKVIRMNCLGGFVEFRSVILSGRRNMSAQDFYNGFVSKVNINKRFFYYL